MQLFEQIRNDNIVKYGTRVSDYIPIIINQYSDRTHFIYEILQNAEDAEATYIKFYLHSDRLEIFHNGRPFNEKDIIGICGIADGTKSDGTRIGHFGIGFKAVYGYTEVPEIYSGNHQFKIVDYLNPYRNEEEKEIPPMETCMVLPFNKRSVSAEVAYREIKEALVRKITAESILMLNKIQDIEIKIDGSLDKIIINKEKGALDGCGNVYGLSLLTTYENQHTGVARENENNYLFFTDANKEATAVIFKVEGKELQEIKNSKIYAFFPTAKEAHQNFLIHAPFDTTPARDNFKEGEEYGKHNIKLIHNIGRLIYFSFCWLRDHGYLSFSGFNKVFPIYEYEETDILYGLYQNSIAIINNGEKLLPTNQEGVYKSIQEICVPENMGIVNVFNDEDLQRLLGNHKIFWLSKEISTNAFSGLKAFLDKNFEFKTYEWRHLVLKMNATFLSEKSLQWMERLMGNIESFCIKRSEQQSHYMDVSRVPFVRLANGEQICAREQGKLQVYLNNPGICKFRIADEFRKNEAIRSFYERALQIPIYDLEREMIDKILPKYATRNVAFHTSDPIRENIEDLKEIKDAIYMNPSILEQIADKYIVTDGKSWYRPGELYIRSVDVRTGYALVKDFIPMRYLAGSYFDDTVMSIKIDEEFFKKIGCSWGIRVIETTREDYLKAVKKYQGTKSANDLAAKVIYKTYISKKMDWSFNYEGFPEVFSAMTPKKSMEIAKFLNSHAMKFDIQGELIGAEDQNFSGSHVESMAAYSMLGLQLCFEKWIYIQGNPEPQSPIEVDKSDLIEGYQSARRLLSILPFKEVKNALLEYFEMVYKDKGDIDLVRRMMADPEEVLKLAKAKAKSEARQAAQEERKESLKERLDRADKMQKEMVKHTDGPEIAPISEKALAKREASLEKELAESLDQHVRVAKGLSFARKACSKEERAFLEAQYEGHCQICMKKITKWNGDSYFEAINIIKQSSLQDSLTNSMGLAWNSLSLCPNCAAEYNYCSKKISSIYDQVMVKDVEPGSEEPIEITIEMPEGKARSIKYSPRHFIALKQALRIFTNR